MTDYRVGMIEKGSDSESEVSAEVDLMSGLTEDVKVESKPDVYWLIAVRVVRLMETKEFDINRIENIIGMAHSVAVYLIVLVLQLLTTGFLMLAASRIEHEYHEIFEGKSHFKLDDATAMMTRAVASATQMDATNASYVKDECLSNLKVRYEWLYCLMIFIWVASMLVEIKEVFDDAALFWGMPRCKKGSRMFLDDGKTVVSLTRPTRMILLTMGPGVRFFVAIVLIISGCKVLLYRQTMMLVVLCSMSLGFVVSLDDLLFGALSGERTKEELKGLTFEYTKSIGRLNKYWTAGLNGMTHAVICMLFSYFYVYWYEHTVMDFRYACWDYHKSFPDDLKLPTSMETFQQMFQTWAKEAFGFLLS